MLDPREEHARQLAYIDRELALGQHDDPGRPDRLKERRADILRRYPGGIEGYPEEAET